MMIQNWQKRNVMDMIWQPQQDETSQSTRSITSEILTLSSVGTFALQHDHQSTATDTVMGPSMTTKPMASSHQMDIGASRTAQHEEITGQEIPKHVECSICIRVSCNREESTASAPEYSQVADIASRAPQPDLQRQEEAASVNVVSIDRYAFERLSPYFLQSALSQEALHRWDKQQGLPPSHARTMLDSGRSRRMVLDLLSGIGYQ